MTAAHMVVVLLAGLASLVVVLIGAGAAIGGQVGARWSMRRRGRKRPERRATSTPGAGRGSW
ncbi:MAG TPA: hypothetical protein VGP31_18310 [Planosporangium sp.]|nr:hypothetical protein [Planosporangium sp.]